jgi:hypothetical protein
MQGVISVANIEEKRRSLLSIEQRGMHGNVSGHSNVFGSADRQVFLKARLQHLCRDAE